MILFIHNGSILIPSRSQSTGEDVQGTRIRQSMAALRLTNPVDDKKRIQDMKGGLHEKSYEWIKENPEYKSWRSDDTSRRLLWINGDPGKGKTMLLCGIINDLEDSKMEDGILSYFFCQATDSQLNSATCVLRGLIYMLAKKQPCLASHVRDEYESSDSAFTDINAWYALERVFKKILDDPHLGRACFIIDALDECEIDKRKLVKLVVEQSSAHAHIKWVVSSRNCDEIRSMLGNIFNDRNGIVNLEANSRAVSDAVDIYIRHKVSRLRKVEDRTVKEQLTQKMCQKAQGTFLWAALTAQELHDADKRHVLKLVDETPPGLDAVYDRMLTKVAEVKRVVPTNSTVFQAQIPVLARSFESTKGNARGRDCDEKVREFTPMAFSPNGLQIMAGFTDGTIKTWDASTGGDLRTLRHGAQIMALEFSTNVMRAISGSGDGTVKIWDMAVGSTVRTLRSGGKLKTVTLSADGRRAVSVLTDGTIKAWDIATGNTLHTPKHGDIVHTVAFSTDGGRLISVSYSGKIRIWDVVAGKNLGIIMPYHRIVTMVFSADSTHIVFGHVGGTITMWDVTTRTLLRKFSHGNGAVLSVTISHNVISGFDDGSIRIWDAETGSNVRTLQHRGCVIAVTFSRNSKLAASSAAYGTLIVWNIEAGAAVQTFEPNGWVNRLEISADGLRMASVSPEIITIWDISSGNRLETTEDGAATSYAAFNSKHFVEFDAHLTLRGEWLKYDGREILWLPPDYQPGFIEACSSAFAIISLQWHNHH
ncbi:unnamed protein product [Parascedosporium putredinis]|uniref:NACHT domain-containing protein n=1 Tax=Parascedosporium putredinis TaxID=1442378 RepID=A0A9P1H4T5_9PEZI|nr:unnamed protein product [Parascedosporium putredinis]CAI7997075.1 unnamed protein product [Parascedosporium putredinis]